MLDIRRTVHDFGGFRLVLTREPANDRMPRHAHDMTSISILLGGALVEEAEHRTAVGMPGSVVVKSASVRRVGALG